MTNTQQCRLDYAEWRRKTLDYSALDYNDFDSLCREKMGGLPFLSPPSGEEWLQAAEGVYWDLLSRNEDDDNAEKALEVYNAEGEPDFPGPTETLPW